MVFFDVLSGFVDLENTVDCGLAENFGPDSGLFMPGSLDRRYRIYSIKRPGRKRLSYVFLPRFLLQQNNFDIWNSLPKNIKDSDTISSFKSKLKSFYFTRLLNVFDGDNFRSFKLICPKCRRINIFSVCLTC